MSAKLLVPFFVGGGVGMMLFASNNNLPRPAYTVNVPFWPFVMLPTGLLWKNKILNKINNGQFPSEMRSYRQLFLVSKKAVLYELFLNQIGYHCILGFTFMAYTYYARTLYDKQTPRKPFYELLAQTFFKFVKLRGLFATLSLVTQFWGAKLSLTTTPEGKAFLSSSTIRLLLIKQTFLNILWMSSVAKLVHDHYGIPKSAQTH